MGQQVNRAPTPLELLLQCVAHGDECVDFGHQLTLHRAEGRAVQPGPLGEVVHAVINPAPDGKMTHEVGDHGNVGHRDSRLGQPGQERSDLP